MNDMDLLGSRPIQPGVLGDNWWGFWFPVPKQSGGMASKDVGHRWRSTATPLGKIGIAPPVIGGKDLEANTRSLGDPGVVDGQEANTKDCARAKP